MNPMMIMIKAFSEKSLNHAYLFPQRLFAISELKPKPFLAGWALSIAALLISINLHAQKGNCIVNDVNLQGKYRGDCPGGYANGKGKAEGRHSYSGEFKNGNKHGEGKLEIPGKGTYKGAFAFDKFNGEGEFKWEDGSKYKGEWKDGKRHGQGEMEYSNGETYTGAWADDKRNGRGEQEVGKETYVGEWKDDKRNGQGRCEFESKDVYEGQWSEGKMEGTGTYSWDSGDTYTGEWRNGRRNGQGEFTLMDKKDKVSEYEGEWKDDSPHGQGEKRWYVNGPEQPPHRYKGNWVRGEMQGLGSFYWPEPLDSPDENSHQGAVYQGEFQSNKMTGKGIKAYDRGAFVKAGVWQDGRFIEKMDAEKLRRSLSARYPDFGE